MRAKQEKGTDMIKLETAGVEGVRSQAATLLAAAKSRVQEAGKANTACGCCVTPVSVTRKTVATEAPNTTTLTVTGIMCGWWRQLHQEIAEQP